MKYNVHLYAIVRVKCVDIEADSQQEAMEKALEKHGTPVLEPVLNRHDCPSGIEYVEYAEKIDGFLVDEQGDEDYLNSQFYDEDMDPVTQDGRPMAECKDCHSPIAKIWSHLRRGIWLCDDCWAERRRRSTA